MPLIISRLFRLVYSFGQGSDRGNQLMRFDGFGKMCLVAGSCGFYLVFRTYKRSERNSGYFFRRGLGKEP